MKRITSTLTIALLLSAPCAIQAGRNRKHKPKVSTQTALLTSTGSTVTHYRDEYNMLTSAEKAFSDTTDEESTLTDITPIKKQQDTPSDCDELMIQRNDAQLLMNRKFIDIMATKQALLVTHQMLEAERNDLAKISLNIWKLSARINALRNPTPSNEKIEPTSGSNNPFNDQTVHTLQETLVAFYDETTGITNWKTLNQTHIKNENGDIKQVLEEYVDTGLTSMGSPSSSSSSSSSHNNNNNNNNNNNSMPAPTTASTSTWLWSMLGYNTTK